MQKKRAGKREVSDKIVIVLLIIAIVISMVGTILVYNSAQVIRNADYSPDNSKVSSNQGQVNINIVPPEENGGGADGTR